MERGTQPAWLQRRHTPDPPCRWGRFRRQSPGTWHTASTAPRGKPGNPGTILPRQDACLPAWLVSRWAVGRGVAGELGAKLATAAVQARFDASGRDAGYR